MTDRRKLGSMYVVGVASSAVTFTPNVEKIGQLVQQLIREDTNAGSMKVS
jgi:cation diffusion facilitator CzcD-associated flavoprotein CzcO